MQYRAYFCQPFREQAEEAPHEERKFLVFESNLRELLAFCRLCHKRCRNEFKLFQTRQDQLLKDLPEDGVEIAGDGRCDSPGYSAK
ncbi:hypothetical protein HPB52_011892 [Rhipicephalus sanguineus]|uniref:Uncharacterized protein n=1 Tax=Rhipicephalus sanguineus TaxID=34632 RepID=A0A9D4T021_RHISA|nr:hypothetical protein HPB52_011892 [Rhipicephalus sanguineus]